MKRYITVAAILLTSLLISSAAAAPPPPEVDITSAPALSTSDTSATFAWNTKRKISSIQCSLDGSVFSSCSSPKTYTGLVVGTHNFVVRVSNNHGTGSDSYQWTITSGSPPPPPSSACSDGVDNDSDGFVDLNDPGCLDSSDTTETDPLGPGWTFCSFEYQHCSFSGTQEVRYGLGDGWTSARTFTDGVSCNNTVFGDPTPGYTKECWRKPTSSPPPPPSITETLYVGGLSTPTAMEFAPNGSLFISQKGGALRVYSNGSLSTFRTFSVATCGEKGLLDTAFDSAGRLHVYYTSSATSRNRVSRIEGGVETVIIDDIAGTNCNHQGGAIDFGPDGKLYIAVGDDQLSSEAQSTSSLRGKILRINPDGTTPSDNPFGNRVWALGLRNPFTMDFSPDGRLYVNDVGEQSFEEVNHVQRGLNYGWPTCEGPCSVSGMTNPIHSYGRSVGQAITGAAFYSGTMLGLNNVYFFGDYLAGFIKYLDSSNVAHNWRTAKSPVSIKMGPDGALYYLSIGDGAVYRIGT